MKEKALRPAGGKVWLLIAAVCALCALGWTPDAGAAQPNIIFILTDDLSWNLVQYMPNVMQMQKDGITFTNYFVTDSLCCPSRSTIFTGMLPHDTGVFTNHPDEGGGYQGFNDNHNEQRTFAVALQNANYQTAMLGKYLNGYEPLHDKTPIKNHPGWTEWDVAGWGYPEFGYVLNQNGTPSPTYDSNPEDYLTDVLNKLGKNFINGTPRPFFIEIATFAPHFPYTPAPRHDSWFSHLNAPKELEAFAIPNKRHTDPSHPYTASAKWLQNPAFHALDKKERGVIDNHFRMRAQAVQAVDEMIGDIRDLLKSLKIANNTYIIFSSDNGYHMGEYRLHEGKQTPFDTDIRVPLIIVGPNVKHGVVDNIVMSTDLCPTFTAMAGVSVPNATTPDGRSLLSLLQVQQGTPVQWRKTALIEHRNGKFDEIDRSPKTHENPPSYEALRTKDELYVEYYLDGKDASVIDRGEYYDVTYYDLKNDEQGTGPLCNVPCENSTSAPCQYYQCAELTNSYDRLHDKKKDDLHNTLCAYRNCKGNEDCWDGGQKNISSSISNPECMTDDHHSIARRCPFDEDGNCLKTIPNCWCPPGRPACFKNDKGGLECTKN